MRSPEQTAKASLVIPILAELCHRGDGTYILKPAVAAETWVPFHKARKALGVPADTLRRQIRDGFLVYKRPSPRNYVVLLESLRRLIRATADPAFWDDPALQKVVQEWVLQEQGKRLAASLQRD